MWIDSHCHLNHNRLQDDAGDVVARANAARVEGMLSINCRIAAEFDDLLALVKPLQNVWCSVGTHPHDAGENAEKAVSLERLIDIAQSDAKIIGIGESGLDYYYDNSPREDQQESFRKHIRACTETGLPLIIHARDADDDIIRILAEEGAGQGAAKLKGVMHCFSSTQKLADYALEIGFYVSFSGMITFKRSVDLCEIAKTIPKERLLVETDAPFLAPEPYRGKMNESAYVVHTGEKLAWLHNMRVADMAALTKANFFTLFDKAKETYNAA